ncbi:hypothetical protein PYW07_008636 [Mythimna separata]|uniref:Uncharacterized protein n=1 Tax=Mythimna separata TaxID=271217 RepID=A0AAD8DP81_MYTSE|nr:hypothetical protein PYW07_008636 [Mythimna separata]
MDKSTKTILFYDLCRLCLENAGVDDMFTKPELIQDVLLCTGVNVASQDNLPRKICSKCLEIVVNAKQLRVLAAANDRHLTSLFDDDETFTIGFNSSSQRQKEGSIISRKSSTDSDRTVKLEIVEHFDSFAEEKQESQSKKRKTSDSSEHNKSEELKKISVRKDLFDSSGAVTSSSKEVTTTSVKQNLKVKIKRIKTDTGDSFHYVCDVCHKKFNAWKKYYLHQKTHNRNIMCPLDVCGKKFATKGDLEKHMRTHTGERPFQCDLCDKRFAQRGSLKSHKLTVHSKTVTPEKGDKS